MKTILSFVLWLATFQVAEAQTSTTDTTAPIITVKPTSMTLFKIYEVDMYFSNCDSFFEHRNAYEWVLLIDKDSTMKNPEEYAANSQYMQGSPLIFTDLDRPFQESKTLYLQFVIRKNTTKEIVAKSVVAKL